MANDSRVRMQRILERALRGRGKLGTRLQSAAKKIEPALVDVVDLELALQSRDAIAEWFDASVRSRVERRPSDRTWILGLDDRCTVSLSHATKRGWSKRSFLKGSVECEWADALLNERLPKLAYRRIWIVYLALVLQSCEPPSAQWAVSIDELAQAYLGDLDEVEYWEDE